MSDMPDHIVTHEQEMICAECMEISDMLISKNQQYGNSIFDPVRVFSQVDTMEQINVRIDDKISRIMRGKDNQEDTELDLLGYLILKRVAKKMKEEEKK